MRNLKMILFALAGALMMSACGAADEGPAGASSLVQTVAEPAGSNCAEGGISIRTGVDDNDDGVLDDAEVDQTSYVCNGAQGGEGEQGEQGEDGEEGAAALVEMEEATGCGDAGGTLVRVGVDINGDGTLQNDEVTSEDEICNAPEIADATILIDEIEIPQGDVCGGGGTQIRVGRDLDEDGELDDDEVESTLTHCGPCPDGYAQDPNDPDQCVVLTTIYFEGVVDSIDDPDGLNPSVAVGDNISGTLTYPGLMTPLDTNSYGRIGEYEITGEVASATLVLPSGTIESAEQGQLGFMIGNDMGFVHQDEYWASSLANQRFEGLDVDSFGINMSNIEGNSYPNDAFRPPITLADAETAKWSLRFSQGADTGGSGPGGGGGQTIGSFADVTGTLTKVEIR